MSRRPLGASLPPDERVTAFEAWIRDAQAAIDELAQAVLEVDTGQHWDGHVVALPAALRHVRAAAVALQELRSRPFRSRRP